MTLSMALSKARSDAGARLTALDRWLRTADGRAYMLLMALALAVRLPLAPFLMRSFDMGAYEFWGHLANIDLFHVYSLSSHGPNWLYYLTYPPLALYLYGVLDKVTFGLAGLFGAPLAHDVFHSWLLRLVLKLPGIFADLALLTILYTQALHGLRRWVAWALAATYALSPGILITVIEWGQTDGVVLLLLVAGLYCALRQRPIWCGILLALTVNFKPQPIVFVPLALVYLWRWGSVRLVVRGAIAFLGVTLLVWLPYLIPPFGELRALARNLAATQAAEGLAASRSGWNLWYALGVAQQSASARLVGPLTITVVGYALFAVVLLIAVVGVWGDPRTGRMWAAAALIALALFTVTPLQFERYLFPALGLFFLAALSDWRYWLPYAFTSVTFMANFGSELFGCNCDPVASRVPAHLQHALLLHLDPWQGGVLNCVALLLAVIFYLRPRVAMQDEAFAWRDTQRPDFDSLGAPVRFGPTRPATASASASTTRAVDAGLHQPISASAADGETAPPG
ncbi:MAG TPA: hypothetical protein VHI51_07480 [Ktedonobacterales bacterium]|nr:hypothetical protein [Ktedonobacterales bacterium]